ncbi:MAG: hypothetical protein QM641_12455, partial [Microbacterium sp.]
ERVAARGARAAAGGADQPAAGGADPGAGGGDPGAGGGGDPGAGGGGDPGAADVRVTSRAQLQRADEALSAFRGNVRADLRGHVARGGILEASVVDALTAALDDASRALTRALRT